MKKNKLRELGLRKWKWEWKWTWWPAKWTQENQRSTNETWEESWKNADDNEKKQRNIEIDITRAEGSKASKREEY